jgi:hypothetical protein
MGNHFQYRAWTNIFKIQNDICAPHFDFEGLYFDGDFKRQRSARLGAALGGMFFFSQWLRLVFHVRLAFEEEPRMKQKIQLLVMWKVIAFN